MRACRFRGCCLAPLLIDPSPDHRAARGRALILVGHGSHLSADSSAPVYAHAASIRALGLFDEVVEAFWKEEPSLPFVLDTVSAVDVWVVPIFLAEGYFTRQVVPRELGLDGPVTIRGGRTIRYCAPIGTHPLMGEMILKRARGVSGLSDEARRSAALVIIGHGTDRSVTSGDTVYRLVEQLREGGEFGSVECGFLDEEPNIAGVLERVEADNVVLVPFFVAEGWHTATTIPQDLDLEGTVTRRGARTIWYAPPVGTLPEVAEVILTLAREGSGGTAPSPAPSGDEAQPVRRAGAPVAGRPEEASGHPDLASRSFSAEDREALLRWVDARPGGADYLQLRIRRLPSGSYGLRHIEDAEVDAAQLEQFADPEQALGIARYTATGEYRPLRTAATLRTGWALTVRREQLWRAISLFYPATIPYWLHTELAETRSRSYAEWAARQTGIYSKLQALPSELLPRVVQACCVDGRCLRTRLWRYDVTLPLDPASQSGGNNGVTAAPTIPCPEPCTLFGSIARQILYADTACDVAVDPTP